MPVVAQAKQAFTAALAKIMIDDLARRAEPRRRMNGES